VSIRSYDPHTSHRDLDSEIERLRVQALAGWTKELRQLMRWGLRDGMSLLEVGAGPGFITERLLQAFPEARVTAIEIDPCLAQQAEARLAKLAGNRLRVVPASLLASGLAAEQFDFAIARLVFQHLPEPVAAAREILRMLKPGGRLAIIDSDDGVWGLAEPPIPEMAAILEHYGRAQATHGGNRQIGRHLWRILEGAGFVNLELEAIVNHSDELGLSALLPQLDPDRLSPLVATGALDMCTLDAFRSSLKDFEADSHPVLAMLMLLAAGTRP